MVDQALDTGQAWDYAPAPEATDIVSIASSYDLFIGGEFVPPPAAATSPR